ncbi:MAG: 3-hydroxyacyl-CoA dehydrogenase NAD-binding domain-containing protein [Candidatus Hodarchaeales archaeon]
MKIEDIKHVAVLGAGNMGHGIAEVALLNEFTVSLYDITEEIVERGKNLIDWSLGKFASKGKISDDDYSKYMTNLSSVVDLEEAVKNADLVIEAAPEIFELKKKIFTDLDKFTPNHAILASNTSNMSLTKLGEVTRRPEKVVGMHYFLPPVMMPIIEIIRGEKTSEDTLKIMVDYAKKAGKEYIFSNDSPGFVINRIMSPGLLLLELMLDRKEYQPEQLDTAAMNLGMQRGPFELLDYLGLDVVYHSMKYIAEHLSKDYTPPLWMENLIQENKLGKKTNEGIYKWPETGRPEIDTSNPADFDVMNLSRIQINEAAKVLEEGIGTAKDIDLGVKLGFNNPWGPFEIAEGTDLEELTTILDGLADKYDKEVFRAHKWIRDGTLMEHVK